MSISNRASYILPLMFQINVLSTDDGMNFYDSRHRFEHLEILLVLLRSLPFASKELQDRALQVLYYLIIFPCPLVTH